jgi:hypothetical protein
VCVCVCVCVYMHRILRPTPTPTPTTKPTPTQPPRPPPSHAHTHKRRVVPRLPPCSDACLCMPCSRVVLSTPPLNNTTACVRARACACVQWCVFLRAHMCISCCHVCMSRSYVCISCSHVCTLRYVCTKRSCMHPQYSTVCMCVCLVHVYIVGSTYIHITIGCNLRYIHTNTYIHTYIYLSFGNSASLLRRWGSDVARQGSRR